jgi:HK97 family phage prohead protease
VREFQTKTIQTGIKAPDGRELERIVLGFELKSLDDEGRGTGFLSVYGNDDSYGDVVDSGAFVKTCAERSSDNPLPFLWQHYSDEPIGVYTRLDPLHEKGLYTEFKYAMGVQRAREAFELAKMRACKGQSIGYTTLQDSVDRSTGFRHLKELRLWEGSQVTFPANDLADIAGVKSALARLGYEMKWSGEASSYTDSEWKAACILDRGADGGGSVKERYGLPVATPGNSWSEHPDSGGVHAAAARFDQVHAPADAKMSARKRLVQCYHKIGEQPPSSLTGDGKAAPTLEDAAAIKALLAEIKGVKPSGPATATQEIKSYLTSR